MQSRVQDLALGGRVLLIVPVVAALFQLGCGGADNAGKASTTERPAPAPAAMAPSQTQPTSAPEKRVLRDIRRRFRDQAWYPLIQHIEVASAEKATIVATKLVNHETPARNRREAKEICQAFLSSRLLDSASVLYDDVEGGSAVSCESG
ncbi:MAG TPA: hypothetical protein VFX35_00235 [Solirubrobacterales bacterium]|nr:hypothetical protein [Solirubrobacterales bacterium]